MQFMQFNGKQYKYVLSDFFYDWGHPGEKLTVHGDYLYIYGDMTTSPEGEMGYYITIYKKCEN